MNALQAPDGGQAIVLGSVCVISLWYRNVNADPGFSVALVQRIRPPHLGERRPIRRSRNLTLIHRPCRRSEGCPSSQTWTGKEAMSHAEQCPGVPYTAAGWATYFGVR